MKLYYLQNYDGRIIQTLYDKDVFSVDLSNLNPSYSVFEIDEIDPLNKYICLDLVKTLNRVNDVGINKYSIENGVLVEEVNWIEKIEILI